MGLFKHIQDEIEARDRREGVAAADLLELSEPLRKLMNRITRQGEITVADAAAHLGESDEDARRVLDSLVAKGFLEREARDEQWVYRTRFARKRARELPGGVWSAISQRAPK